MVWGMGFMCFFLKWLSLCPNTIYLKHHFPHCDLRWHIYCVLSFHMCSSPLSYFLWFHWSSYSCVSTTILPKEALWYVSIEWDYCSLLYSSSFSYRFSQAYLHIWIQFSVLIFFKSKQLVLFSPNTVDRNSFSIVFKFWVLSNTDILPGYRWTYNIVISHCYYLLR